MVQRHKWFNITLGINKYTNLYNSKMTLVGKKLLKQKLKYFK